MNYQTAKKQWNNGEITITLPASWLNCYEDEQDSNNISVHFNWNTGSTGIVNLSNEDKINLSKFAMKSVSSKLTILTIEPKGDGEFFLRRLTKSQYYKRLFQAITYRFRILFLKKEYKWI